MKNSHPFGRFRRAVDLADFARRPVESFLLGPSWLNFCPAKTLWISAVWGRPSVQDMADLLACCQLEVDAGHPYRCLFDVSQAERLLPESFDLLDAYLTKNRARLSLMLDRFAILHAQNTAAALTLGSLHLLDIPGATAQFTNVRLALDWLEPVIPPGVLHEACELYRTPELHVTLLWRLRNALSRDLQAAQLAGIAPALGLAPRTLQRELTQLGTTFRAQLAAARLDRAQTLLREGASVTAVAMELGYGSPQSFDRQFRQLMGTSPGRWRSHSSGAN